MALELQNVSKRVGAETHIHPTDLTLPAEGFNVLLGATNAGKTTLIKMMAGLETPTTGRIILDGRDITEISTQRRNVSLVHQFFVNYPNMNVFENIASPLRVAGVRRDEIERRVGEAAELLRLTPFLQRRPGELSGGQQQRCALARAIVKDSDIVLLDEPLANLDYKLREELRDELPRLFSGRGAVVVYATSEPHEALLLAGRTATLLEGRVTQFGVTPEVYRNPETLETAQVFSDPPVNVATVSVAGGRVSLPAGAEWPAPPELASAAEGKYLLAVRPHRVTPEPEKPDSVKVTGEVLITELTGSESVAHFDLGDGLTWVSQTAGAHPYEIGAVRDFYIDPRGCRYFDTSGASVAA